jgi:cyclic-di-AMP phosphodiesterase PgpH
MFGIAKQGARRAEIRRQCPAASDPLRAVLQRPDVRVSLLVLAAFVSLATAIATLRERVVRYRLNEYVHQDVLSRVDFRYTSPERVAELQQVARESAPRVYRSVASPIAELEKRLLTLPEAALRAESAEITEAFGPEGRATLRKVRESRTQEEFSRQVRAFIQQLSGAITAGRVVVLSHNDRTTDGMVPLRQAARIQVDKNGTSFTNIELANLNSTRPPASALPEELDAWEKQRDRLLPVFTSVAGLSFESSSLARGMAMFALGALGPTHELDNDLTAREQNEAASSVRTDSATRSYPANWPIVLKGRHISESDFRVLAEEQKVFVTGLPTVNRVMSHLGMSGIVLLVGLAMAVYTATYQKRVIQNHMRAIAIAGLLLASLLASQLSAVSALPVLVFAVAPTVLAAMILAIAYDQRFALGITSLHAILVTTAAGQGMDFFLVMWSGILTCCNLLTEVRSRGKLIEVGFITAFVMAATAVAAGAISLQSAQMILRDALQAGGGALAVGFVALGLLPFIERTFGITTNMTLLEIADVRHPLLNRLALEAPGTYNHSMQVAALAEAAAQAIGANALLCRVGAYFHDVGKINKADYFVENQSDGVNRHLNLTPNVSLLVILGHVKDGVEMAKAYRLPRVVLPFIQEHHGTTLVEYFYHEARKRQSAEVSDSEYRYPGPRPRSREIAIVMLADSVESASRTMEEPTSARVEGLVHELAMRRLHDGQFDDSNLTFGELDRIQKSMVKALLAIHHRRLQYPALPPLTGPAASVRSA